MKKLLVLFVALAGLLIFSGCGSTDSTTNYQVSISTSPSEGGSVSPSSGQYEEGTSLDISATPSEEYRFVEWQGDYTGTSSSATITVDSDKNIQAIFAKKEYALTINREGEGTVDELVIQTTSTTDYESGTIVELTANPAEGWKFVEWQGDITSNENPTQITVDEPKEVTAVFEKQEFKLEISITGEGSVKRDPDSNFYSYGDTVRVTANPSSEWFFNKFENDSSSIDNPLILVMNKNVQLVVNFVKKIAFNKIHEVAQITEPNDLAISDMDNDGDKDIIVASANFHLFENNGHGFFEENHPGINSVNRWIYTKDIDNDGDQDIISSRCYSNNGKDSNGNYSFITKISCSMNGPQNFSADLNNDNYIDLLAPYDNNINWRKNVNGNSFDEPKSITASAEFTNFIFPIDLNNDGNIDIINNERGDSYLSWYRNKGDATFSNEIILTNKVLVNAIASGDIDKDGDNDIFVCSFTNSSNNIFGFLNNGNGKFSERIVIPTSLINSRIIYLQDLNKDNYPELIVGSEKGKIDIIKNDNGTFTNNYTIYPNIDSFKDINQNRRYGLDFGDIDGDSDIDIASSSFYNNRIIWFENSLQN